MREMKKIKYLLLVVAVLLLTGVSCDVLDEQIVSGVTEDSHYSTPNGFRDAVKASYERFREFYGRESGCANTVFGTDEYTNGGHGGYQYFNKYIAGLDGDAGYIRDPWNAFYQGINTCNAALRWAPEADVPEAEKSVLVGEVKFLRSQYYFLLVQLWGPVHLTLEETIGVETEANRTSEAEIYDAIIADLNDAIAVLPGKDEVAQFGRISKPAAQHALALAYLTRAYQSYGQANDFSMAANLAVEVINNSGHVLLDDYQRIYNSDDGKGGLVHTTESEQNDEIIWSIQYDSDMLLNDQGNQNHLYFRCWYETFNDGLDRALGHGYGRPWIRFRPTPWLLENFRPLDVDARYVKSFQDTWYYNTDRNIPAGAHVGDTAIYITSKTAAELDTAAMFARLPGVKIYTWNLDEYDEDWCLWRTDVSVNAPLINIFPVPWKWDDNLRPSLNEQRGSRDFPVYRLGETYLVAAEAMYGRDGNASAAVQYINAIRERAAFDGKEADMHVGAGEVDLDFILDEWSREVFGEQQRWLDLKRTGKLIERVKAHNPDAQNIKDFHALRPIPTTQITRCTNDYGQNPGY
jgi:hypothetical protein